MDAKIPPASDTAASTAIGPVSIQLGGWCDRHGVATPGLVEKSPQNTRTEYAAVSTDPPTTTTSATGHPAATVLQGRER